MKNIYILHCQIKTHIKYLFSLIVLISLTHVATGQKVIRGKVTDNTDNSPLVGAVIAVSAAPAPTAVQNGEKPVAPAINMNAVETDAEGNYTITVQPADEYLQFTFIGYETQTVKIDDRSLINIALIEQANLFDEVVVVGYGTTKKVDLTGSASTVKGEDISKIATNSVGAALQGKAAGVQVFNNNGQPGSQPIIRIRGVGTMNNSNPLYVVDGIITNDIGFLNTNEIETIDILKDASTTAIYGSRAANGVVMITTKKGKKGEARINVSTSQTNQQLAHKIELANAREYATIVNEIQKNNGAKPKYSNPDSLGEGTDWQDAVFRNAPMRNYNMSISGGTDFVSYYISGDYLNQDGIINGSNYERFGIRMNNTYKIKPYLTLGHNISVVRMNGKYVPDVSGVAYRTDPTLPIYKEDGSFQSDENTSAVGNPVADIFYKSNNKDHSNRVIGNIYAEIKFLNDFTFKSSFNLGYFNYWKRAFTPVFKVGVYQQNVQNSLTLGNQRALGTNFDNTLMYNKTFNRLAINTVVGITTYTESVEDETQTGKDLVFEDDNQISMNVAEPKSITGTSGGSSYAMLSYFLRTNLTFDDKYLLTFTGRYDGSSKFADGRRWGLFPAIGLGWRISEEPFLKSSDVLNNLKLRVSYGKIGNDRVNSDFPYLSTITQNLYSVFGQNENVYFGAIKTTINDTRIQWESTTTSDIGLEFGFFNSKLQGEIDYYNRKTSDILVSLPIPDYLGYENSPVINAASMRNTGLEFSLNWFDTKVVDYMVGFNISTLNNKVLDLGNGQANQFAGGLGVGGRLGTNTYVGAPIGNFWGYKTAGVFQNQAQIDATPHLAGVKPGDYIYVDSDKNGILNEDDRVSLGNSIPKLIYGASFGLGYKGVDLTVDFNGQYGNKIINAKKMARFNTPNFEKSAASFWTSDGSTNEFPRATNGGYNYEYLSDKYVEDGSYFRIRNIQLSYSLPYSMLTKIKLTSVKVFISATNPVTWTKYTGYTPEIFSNSPYDSGIDAGVYPTTKAFTIGGSVTF